MSKVDTQFSTAERNRLLGEVRVYLPAFLGADSIERIDPAGDVRRLLNLTAPDLGRVVAVHIALSEEIGLFVAGLLRATRHPIPSTTRSRVTTQSVVGPIDWSATIKHRATSGWDATRYVVRPARRIFDTPENRALVWILEVLETILVRALPATDSAGPNLDGSNWHGMVRGRYAAVAHARKTSWLRQISPERPGADAFRRLSVARTIFYRESIPAAIRVVEQLTEHPSAEDLVEVLARRYFEPSRDWKLFELVVALRLANVFSKASKGESRSRLLTGGPAPYASYSMPDGSHIRLWYQSWPSAAGPSEHLNARVQYAIQSGPVRPDIIVERVKDGRHDAILLELKATRSPSYLSQGIFQLLGYRADRPSLFSGPSPAWLVAPESAAFTSAQPAGLSVWAVSDNQVAPAALTYFGFLAEQDAEDALGKRMRVS